MLTFSTTRRAPERNLIALRPAVPGLLPLPRSPSSCRLRRITTSPAPAETTMPLVPETSTEAIWPPPPSMVMDLVIVTAPNPPGSSASISPPASVLEMAPANVLQGAVRLHGFASLPTPETNVRDACACSIVAPKAAIANKPNIFVLVMVSFSPSVSVSTLLSSAVLPWAQLSMHDCHGTYENE